jgi:predicted transposase/invertase (TIGR01784 family)
MEQIKKDPPSSIFLEDGMPSKYVNPLTDFGFKLLFGIKDAMINFLNSILKIEGGIIDLTYINVEMIPYSEEERQARYDLHCTTGTGERIIIEMQNNSQAYYKDRSIFYAAFNIVAQAPKKKDWDYRLDHVYSVNIIDFCLKDTKKLKPSSQQETAEAEEAEDSNNYITFVELRRRDNFELFYDKLTFVFLELPKFNTKETEINTDIEKWMFIVRYMDRLKELPDFLRNELFKDIFEAAEIAKMTKEDRQRYFNSLKNYRDMNNALAQREYKIEEWRQRYDRDIAAQQQKYHRDIAAYQQENADMRREIEKLQNALNQKNGNMLN